MKLVVIKIGGNIVDSEEQRHSFLQSFAGIADYKILVHGGGKIATELGKKLGIEANYVNGRRITDKQTLDLVTMVYGGLINKQMVAQLQQAGCNAIGLTGADGAVMPADKRLVKEVDYGYVGDVCSEKVNGGLLKQLLEAGLIPVLAPLTYDGEGGMLNTNADTIAQEVAKAMSGIMDVQLIYCFEKKGVLADANDDDSVITKVTATDFETLKADGIVTAGMIPKLENAFAAINYGVHTVTIGHAASLQDLISGNAGTCIQ